MEVQDTKIWIIISLCTLLFLLMPGINHGLWRPDEPRVAGTCAEMARSHDFVVPRLNGHPFLEKPPLYYAVASVSGSLLGVDSDVPYRLVSVLFALLTVFITCAMASRRSGLLTGIMAGGILASSGGFFQLARWIQVDMALVFGVSLAMYAYLKAVEPSKERDSVVLGLAVGIAFMAKGLVGPAIIAAAIFMDVIRRKDFRILIRIRPHITAACAIAVVLPWVAALWSRGGWPFIREVIVVNNLMRFTGAPEGAALGHQHGLLYYFKGFPFNFLPWTLLFIPAVIASFRRFREDSYISWFVGPFILLLMSSTKRDLYLVPLYPAAACITATWLVQAGRVRWEENLVRITWCIAVACSFIPFAGIILGLPVLSFSMGLLAVTSLVLISMLKVKNQSALFLVLLMCTALSASSAVYYSYMKTDRDYLDFTRQAMVAAGNREVIILSPDEVMEGVLPMVTGKHYREVKSLADIREEGVYIWTDKDDRILKSLKQFSVVKILFEKRIDFKDGRMGRIAFVKDLGRGLEGKGNTLAAAQPSSPKRI